MQVVKLPVNLTINIAHHAYILHIVHNGNHSATIMFTLNIMLKSAFLVFFAWCKILAIPLILSVYIRGAQ